MSLGSPCFYLPRAGIIGVHHHARLTLTSKGPGMPCHLLELMGLPGFKLCPIIHMKEGLPGLGSDDRKVGTPDSEPKSPMFFLPFH